MVSYSYRQSKPKVYDVNIDLKNLTENEYYLATWTNLEDIIVEAPENRIITFPIFRYDEKIKINNYLDAWYELHSRARRVRNYLSFIFKMQIPLKFKTVGKRLLMPSGFSSDQFFLMAGFYILDKKQEELNKIFDVMYETTKKLLRNFKIDSFEDKIINLFGFSLWTQDALENFMYRWRIIELIANKEIKNINLENFGEFGKHVEDDFVQFLGRWSILNKIKFVTKKYNLNDKNFDFLKLKECKKLRDDISHGDITIKTYSSVLKNSNFIKSLSEKFLILKFEDFKMHFKSSILV